MALMDIGQNHVQAGLHDPQWARGEDRALVIETAHKHPDTLVLRAKAISAGTSQSTKTSSQVLEPRMPACLALARWKSRSWSFRR